MRAMSKDDRNNPDPLRTIRLMWDPPPPPSRGPKASLTAEQIVETAVRLADEAGTEALSMRLVARDLGCGTMSLYTYVSSKAELLELMVDQVFAEVEYDPTGPADPADWRAGLERVAEQNLNLLFRHRWLTDVDTTRPPLGPGTIAKYDAELRPLIGTGLDDVEIDRTLALVLDHVRSSARQLFLAEAPPTADGDWWEQAGPLLAAALDPARYPVASRVGQAAGEQYGAPADPRGAYTFGLRTILDGVASLIARRSPSAG